MTPLIYVAIIIIFLVIVVSGVSYSDCSIYGNCGVTTPITSSNATHNGTTYHNLLSGLAWSIAGHIIDTALNLNNNNLYGVKDMNVTNVIVSSNFSAKRAFYYGYDNSTQAFLNSANAQIINISNNADHISYQIAIEGSKNVTFQTTGEYLIALSPEFFQDSGTAAKVTFWMQKTDDSGGTFSDVAWSNSRYTIPNNAYNAPTIEFPVVINDTRIKVRFMWWSDSTNTKLYSSEALTSPTRPSIPAILINIRKSSALV